MGREPLRYPQGELVLVIDCAQLDRSAHKQGKNRVHLDLRTRELEPETRRLVSLGARILTEQPVTEHGWRWHIMADPDGNEFCVLQPPASYWAG